MGMKLQLAIMIVLLAVAVNSFPHRRQGGRRGGRGRPDGGPQRDRGFDEPRNPGPPREFPDDHTGDPLSVDPAFGELRGRPGQGRFGRDEESEDHTGDPLDRPERGGRPDRRRRRGRPEEEDHTGDPREREDRTGGPLDRPERPGPERRDGAEAPEGGDEAERGGRGRGRGGRGRPRPWWRFF